MEYLGAWETLIHEKNWSRKSRVRLPLSQRKPRPLLKAGGWGVKGDNAKVSIFVFRKILLFTENLQQNQIRTS